MLSKNNQLRLRADDITRASAGITNDVDPVLDWQEGDPTWIADSRAGGSCLVLWIVKAEFQFVQVHQFSCGSASQYLLQLVDFNGMFQSSRSVISSCCFQFGQYLLDVHLALPLLRRRWMFPPAIKAAVINRGLQSARSWSESHTPHLKFIWEFPKQHFKTKQQHNPCCY